MGTDSINVLQNVNFFWKEVNSWKRKNGGNSEECGWGIGKTKMCKIGSENTV